MPQLSGAGGLLGAAAVAACGAVAGFGPARLFDEVRGPDTSGWSSGRLALIAAVGGLLAYAAAWALGQPWTGAALGAAIAVLLAAMLVDACWLVIPDLYWLALLALALVGPLSQPVVRAAIGGAIGAGLLFAVREVFRRGRKIDALGLGDVKLAAAIGALLGPVTVLWVIAIGAAGGAVWGLTRARRSPEATPLIPFGSALAVCAGAALLMSRLSA